MKFSYQWLSELVSDLSVEPEQLKRLITMKTAECEGIEAFGAHFARVRVVRVAHIQPVASGKNKLVDVEDGPARHQVICGAPNVRPGMLAVWIPPGTVLNGKTIGVAVIDGVESEGMLASAAELGVGRDASGLLEVAGGAPGQAIENLRPDWVIEIDNKSLTHRPDLWGHLGMAREIAAICGTSLLDPVPPLDSAYGKAPVTIQIADSALCQRYSALLIADVTVADSPPALAARLEAVGLNPINNIVDVTNFILAELPQPMHAFDADKISGDTIFVRKTRAGEKLDALNGESYQLHPDDLVIADESGPIALAGVIGGSATAISAGTKRILLESANFNAAGVRLTSARHKLRTDASVRFEKSLDPENTVRGLARASALIRAMCPESKTSGIADRYVPASPVAPIALPVAYVSRKLGRETSEDQITYILNALGFATVQSAPGILTVSVPSWRATKDISLKADLVEEVGRMIGYDEIPPQAPRVASTVPPRNEWQTFFRFLRRQMSAQGFTEIYSYSFVDAKSIERFGMGAHSAVAISNPIASKLSYMRPTLLPGVFQTLLANVRNFREFRIFEIGNQIEKSAKAADTRHEIKEETAASLRGALKPASVLRDPLESGSGLPDEVPHLVAALYGAHADEGDFFEMKRVLECFLPGARVKAADAHSYEHPARAAVVTWHGIVVGRLFELHPGLLEEEDVEGRAIFFDIDLKTTLPVRNAQRTEYVPPRRYPTSGFDLSIITTLRTPVVEIQDGLTSLAGSELAALEFVRQYDGPPLPQGQKSVTYHLEIGRTDRTITTEEVAAVRNGIVEGMRKFGFDFRGSS